MGTKLPESVKQFILNIITNHLYNTPYYMNRLDESEKKNLLRSLERVRDIEGFVNTIFDKENYKLILDINNLRDPTFVIEYLIPINWRDTLETAYSSGTTGPRKYGFMSMKYIDMASYDIVLFLRKYLGIERITGYLYLGPTGEYDRWQRRIAEGLGAKYIFPQIAVELDLISKPEVEKGKFSSELSAAYFKYLIGRINFYFETFGKYIDMFRGVLQIIPFIINSVRNSNLKYMIVSGLDTSPDKIEEAKEQLKGVEIIPFFGYFLVGDVPGIYKRGKTLYYPKLPYEILIPVKIKKEKIEVAEEGEEGYLAFIIIRPEIMAFYIEKDIAIRERGLDVDWPIAFSNPRREVKPS